jgi:hypothetical protein
MRATVHHCTALALPSRETVSAAMVFRFTSVLAVLAVLAVFAVAACGDGAPGTRRLALQASEARAPADGATKVTLTASLPDAPAGAVMTFSVAGVGMLASTNAAVEAGVARVELYAPFEDELGPSSSVTSRVTATASFDPALLATVDVEFTAPTDGAPALDARAEPDHVVAGSGESITIVVDGRRLASNEVTVSTTPPGVIDVPATLTLDAALHGELTVPAPSSPLDATVRIAAEGASVDVVLHFVAPDAPLFDVSGTFAEVQYGVVEIGGLIFLDPDPQCVIAPTLLLARITQTDRHVRIETTTCAVQMPTVRVILVGESTTTVGPGFVDATNARGGVPLEAELDEVAPGAAFAPTAASFGVPLIVGAELASDDDALPTTADDARVRDDDNDGFPGVTITNSNQGDQHCVFRTQTTSMTGTIVSSDAIDGVVVGHTETNILNGGGGGLAPTVTGAPSPFAFRRVDGRNGAPDISQRDGDASSISCDDVNAFAAELMALAPPPDTSTACDE